MTAGVLQCSSSSNLTVRSHSARLIQVHDRSMMQLHNSKCKHSHSSDLTATLLHKPYQMPNRILQLDIYTYQYQAIIIHPEMYICPRYYNCIRRLSNFLPINHSSQLNTRFWRRMISEWSPLGWPLLGTNWEKWCETICVATPCVAAAKKR